MDYHKVITRLFEYFYYKVFNKHYKLDLDINNQKKLVDNFLKLLGQQYGLPSIGVDWLITYFVFSFNYWRDKNIKRPLTLNWIIGKKMFKKFVDKDEHSDYFCGRFTMECDIDTNALRQELNEDESEYNNHSEELEKRRFTGEGRLHNCIINTTLYNHRSKICIMCTQKVDCKQILKKINLQLYKKRGYE